MRTSRQRRIQKQNKPKGRVRVQNPQHVYNTTCVFVRSELHFWVLNIQSQEGKWSVRRKWSLQSDIVFLRLKQNTNAEQNSWPEVQHFRDLKEDIVWYGDITSSPTISVNTINPACFALLSYCSIVSLTILFVPSKQTLAWCQSKI